MFRRSKNNDDPITVGRLDGASGPVKHSKTHSYDIHDPVLTAIRDEEPFQMSANTNPNQAVTATNSNGQTSSPDTQIRDVFGNVISAPDRSNPTRPRDERPLDTIRAFEYLCTGDERLREEMETVRYGWTPRPNFPSFQANPYTAPASVMGYQGADGEGVPLSDPNAEFKTYNPANSKAQKKRGFFGRKKKN